MNMFITNQFGYAVEPTLGVEFASKIETTKRGNRMRFQIWDTPKPLRRRFGQACFTRRKAQPRLLQGKLDVWVRRRLPVPPGHPNGHEEREGRAEGHRKGFGKEGESGVASKISTLLAVGNGAHSPAKGVIYIHIKDSNFCTKDSNFRTNLTAAS